MKKKKSAKKPWKVWPLAPKTVLHAPSHTSHCLIVVIVAILYGALAMNLALG